MSGPTVTGVIRLTDEFSPALMAIVRNLDAFSAALRSDTANKQEVFNQMSVSAKQLAETLKSVDLDTRNISGKGLSSELNRAANETQRMKSDMSAVLKDTGAIAESFARIANGLIAMGAVSKITSSVKAFLAQGADVSEGQAKLINMGATPQEIAARTEAAKQTAAHYTLTTPSRALEDVAELRAQALDINGNVNNETLDQMTQATAKERQRLAGSGLDFAQGDLRAVSQATEGTAHAGDPAFFEKLLGKLTSASIQYNNPRVFEDYLTMVRNAKSTGIALSDKELLGTYVVRSATEQSARLGNEASQTAATLVGGKMTKQSAERLVDLGLIESGQIKNGEGGKFYIDGGVKEANLLNSNQFEWINRVFAPAIEKVVKDTDVKAGTDRIIRDNEKADPTHKTTQDDIDRATKRAYEQLVAAEIYKLGFRGTVGDNLTHSIANEKFVEREAAQLERMGKIDPNAALSANAGAALNELTTSLDGLMQTLSEPLMGDAASALHTIAGSLASFGETITAFQKAHPDLSKALVGNGLAATTGAAAGLSIYSITQLFAAGPALTAAAGELSVAAVELGAAGVAGKVSPVATAATATAGTTAAEVTEAGILGTVAKSGILGKLGTYALRGIGFYSAATDTVDAAGKWNTSSGNDKAWQAFNIFGDLAATKGGTIGAGIFALTKAFDYIHENSKNYKWQTTEQEDIQAEVNRQLKDFSAATGIPVTGSEAPKATDNTSTEPKRNPKSPRPEFMSWPEYDTVTAGSVARARLADERYGKLDRQKGDDVLPRSAAPQPIIPLKPIEIPPIKSEPVKVDATFTGKAEVQSQVNVSVGLDKPTNTLVRKAIDVGLQANKPPLPGMTMSGPQGVR